MAFGKHLRMELVASRDRSWDWRVETLSSLASRGERLEVEATASDQLFNVSCVYNEASIKPRRAGFGDLLDDRTHESRESDTTRESMEAPCPFPVSHPV